MPGLTAESSLLGLGFIGLRARGLGYLGILGWYFQGVFGGFCGLGFALGLEGLDVSGSSFL